MVKNTVIVGLLALLSASVVMNFGMYQDAKAMEYAITTETIDDVTLEHFMDQTIDLRAVEFIINGHKRRFAIGEIRNDDSQPGGGRLPMTYVYNGQTPVAKVLVPPFRSER